MKPINRNRLLLTLSAAFGPFNISPRFAITFLILGVHPHVGSCSERGSVLCPRQAHQEKAGQDPQALRAPPDRAVPPDVRETPESVGLLDPLDTATPLSASVFLTTGKDT